MTPIASPTSIEIDLLPEQKQLIGTQGTIVECHDPKHFEVEFSNEDGETTALCVLSSQQFIVVWKAKTKQWLIVFIKQQIHSTLIFLKQSQKFFTD